MLACLASAARLRWLQFLALLTTLAIVGSHSDTCNDNFHTSCPTTQTASTTIGVSLVQGLSLNRRVDSERVRELLNEQGGTKDGQRHSGRRDVGADVTGPKGQRDLHLAHGNAHGTSNTLVDPDVMNEGFHYSHTTEIPLAVEPLLSAQPGSDDPDSPKILNPEAGVWGETLRKYLPSMLQQVLTRMEPTMQPTNDASQMDVANPKKQASAGIVIVLVILLVLFFICWKVTRPEPIAFVKPPHWGQSTHAQQQRTSVMTRSPRGPSVPVGEPRQLAPRTSPMMPGSAGIIGPGRGGGVDRLDSSSDEWEGTADGDVFCPDLVVPQQCECILVVPVYAPVGSFGIADMNGRSVLQAASQVQGQGLLWQLHLQTTTGESLARCIEVPSSPSMPPSFHILDAKGKYFASLSQVQGQQRFELTTQNGFKLHFYGNFQTQAVNVTDENDSLLATTEPCGADFDQTGIYYRLRVAPLANVGHSLCALLCIGQILRPRASVPVGGAI